MSLILDWDKERNGNGQVAREIFAQQAGGCSHCQQEAVFMENSNKLCANCEEKSIENTSKIVRYKDSLNTEELIDANNLIQFLTENKIYGLFGNIFTTKCADYQITEDCRHGDNCSYVRTSFDDKFGRVLRNIKHKHFHVKDNDTNQNLNGMFAKFIFLYFSQSRIVDMTNNKIVDPL